MISYEKSDLWVPCTSHSERMQNKFSVCAYDSTHIISYGKLSVVAVHNAFQTIATSAFQVQTCSSDTRVGRARSRWRELHRRTVGLEYRSTITLEAVSSDCFMFLYSVEPCWTHPSTSPQLASL